VDDALKYIISMGVVVPGGPGALPGKSVPDTAQSASSNSL